MEEEEIHCPLCGGKLYETFMDGEYVIVCVNIINGEQHMLLGNGKCTFKEDYEKFRKEKGIA